MTRSRYFVTSSAGAWIAGRRVDLLEPGPSGVVELELTHQEAAEPLRIGALSEAPPEKSPQTARQGPRTGSDAPSTVRKRRSRQAAG